MTEIAFYHLQQKRLEEALPQLLEKAVERGLRAVVLAESEERVAALNSLLWTYKREGFLPHGAKADGRSDVQSIYLTEAEENPNGAALLVAVDGARLEYVEQFQRCLDLFDGNDELAVAAARERWKAAKAHGHKLTYWQQTERGGWENKAEA
jgi:DNA polymerase-3 subunit chi